MRFALCLGWMLLVPFALHADDAGRLAQDLAPWLELVAGRSAAFTLTGNAAPMIDGKPQPIQLKLVKHSAEAFDLELEHPQYAAAIRRRANGIALAVPKHRVVFLGRGVAPDRDHLHAEGLTRRLIGDGTAVSSALRLIEGAEPADVAGTLVFLAKLKYSADAQTWSAGEKASFRFADAGRKLTAKIDGVSVDLQLRAEVAPPAAIDAWPDYRVKELTRAELETQLTRGARRALEVLLPSDQLKNPPPRERSVAHGELRWVDGQRVVLLDGTPEQIGQAHGELLATESQRCIDSVLYGFGTVQAIVTGRWFREDLEAAYQRLAPHIPHRHKVETRALAAALKLDPKLVETINVFPELFHCSGFALFGSATQDGKLYHGRVLDYMTTIGLQDCATTFIVAPDGKIPFANVGYAGFIGSVSGMNAEQISLGEMGGRGEGKWDGVPMATLMRRALEECDSLEEVKALWRDNPRTCEYYYVFADGKAKTAVGVAATPDSLQFVNPGEGHSLLGDGIRDTVVLSAGDRLKELRKRVTDGHGKFDATSAQALMCRPVAMSSNLHNVLFVPEDGVLYVANANHAQPAADRPYVKLDLRDYLRQIRGKSNAAAAALKVGAVFPARDSLQIGEETSAEARTCLAGLQWTPGPFDVTLQSATKHGDWLVRFASPQPVGTETNDEVALEWYQAKDEDGKPLRAPAVVVVHESGRGMTVGRMIAQLLRAKGLHAFLIHLPYYGERQGAGRPQQADKILAAAKQGIVDVRRARDAIAALPLVDDSRISLQGTSLGGFVAATTAGLDDGFHRTFILLAGGDIHGVVMNGKRDAAKVREELHRAGLTDDAIKEMFAAIEPLRLAHRVNAERTWVFSGTLDEVVPLKNAEMFAKAAALDEKHHVKLLANHYSGIILLPLIVQQMRDCIYSPTK